jgi:hypothetical protein
MMQPDGYLGLLNSSISRQIFGIVTNEGRPNSAASFSLMLTPLIRVVVTRITLINIITSMGH